MFSKYRKSDFKEPYAPSFTVPDQSFTPRQILEQFASGEVVAQRHDSTDDFYDNTMSDDDLVDKVVDVVDEFQARQYVLDFKLAQDEAKASDIVRSSTSQGAAETINGVSNSTNLEGSPRQTAEGVASA